MFFLLADLPVVVRNESALRASVADGATVPRPCQLRHVLHNVQMGVARKVDWASDMLKETRADMMRYVYGVANLKATFKFDASVLEALRGASSVHAQQPSIRPRSLLVDTAHSMPLR